LVVVSSKVGRGKKESGDSSVNGICTVASLPAAVSLLLLEALFIQISGVSLTLA
jgi:hypothetical protein